MLDKAIKYGKEHRRQYSGAKAIAKSCRNHGACNWCQRNRTYRYIKKKKAMEKELERWIKYGEEI